MVALPYRLRPTEKLFVTVELRMVGIHLISPPGAAGTAPKGKSGSEHSHGSPGKPHISSMAVCVKGQPELKLNRMKPGQVWTVEAHYDYQRFAGATHPNGQQENVMGIGIMYVRK
jgi:hypothetical protein